MKFRLKSTHCEDVAQVQKVKIKKFKGLFIDFSRILPGIGHAVATVLGIRRGGLRRGVMVPGP